MSRYADVPTIQLWNALPHLMVRSISRGRGAPRVMRVSGSLGATASYVRTEASRAYATVDTAMRAAGKAIEYYTSGQASREWVTAWLDWSRSELNKTREEMMREGAIDAGDAIHELFKRLGWAIRDIGKGAGDGYREFWGISPAVGLSIGLGVLALVALMGGGLLLSATLGPLGAGLGKAAPTLAREIPKVVGKAMVVRIG